MSKCFSTATKFLFSLILYFSFGVGAAHAAWTVIENKLLLPAASSPTVRLVMIDTSAHEVEVAKRDGIKWWELQIQNKLIAFAQNQLLSTYVDRGIVAADSQLLQEFRSIEGPDERSSYVLAFVQQPYQTQWVFGGMLRIARVNRAEPLLPMLKRIQSRLEDVGHHIQDSEGAAKLLSQPMELLGTYPHWRLPRFSMVVSPTSYEALLADKTKPEDYSLASNFDPSGNQDLHIWGTSMELKNFYQRKGLGVDLIPLIYFAAEDHGLSYVGESHPLLPFDGSDLGSAHPVLASSYLLETANPRFYQTKPMDFDPIDLGLPIEDNAWHMFASRKQYVEMGKKLFSRDFSRSRRVTAARNERLFTSYKGQSINPVFDMILDVVPKLNCDVDLDGWPN